MEELHLTPPGPKVLFLDVEGVIVSWKHIMSGKYRNDLRDVPEPHLSARVNRILQETGAVIVLSAAMRQSFRRDLPGLRAKLAQGGLHSDVLIDITPRLYEERGHEIQAWLDENPTVTDFLILDDEVDMVHLLPHFLHVKDRQIGITEEEMLEAIRRLT